MFPLALVLMLGAQLPDELDALTLADQTRSAPPAARDWTVFAELAGTRSAWRGHQGRQDERRLSIDLALDRSIAPGWRVILADRLDAREGAGEPSVNTLKEAYLSWQARPDLHLDAGRINAFQGVAVGYNPTDLFREGALRSLVSVEPESLKKNRQGSVMLRVQQLGNHGALTAVLAPELAERRSSSALALDLGATNASTRWQLAYTQQAGPRVNLQWLLYRRAHEAVQLGASLSALANARSTVFLEWSGGRMRSDAARAMDQPGQASWRNRMALGGTYTTAANVALTLEYQANSAAPAAGGLRALAHTAPAAYGRVRAWQFNVLELPSRREWFAHATWSDALVRHVDLAALAKISAEDHSHLAWTELRYRMRGCDLSLQRQQRSGEPWTAYGAAALRGSWHVALRCYA